MAFDLAGFLRAERLPEAYAETIRTLHEPLADRIAAARAGPGAFVVGLTGPQGSGKTTAAAVLAALLEARNLRVAILALDDLYLTLAHRQRLAAEVHPLLLTRGVPGTHDVALGEALIASLAEPGETLLPRFDKATDDRAPRADWRRVQGPFDVILFEGWCVGARPQSPEALVQPVNDLERTRDPDGVWRGYANAQLAGPYRRLFAVDFQALFLAPSFETVLTWRLEQERKLRERLDAEHAPGSRGQSDAELAVFVQHYERLTRWIAEEMPARADAVVRLGAAREVLGLSFGR